MSIFGQIIGGAAGQAAEETTGEQRSLRFSSDLDTYLDKTFSSAGDRRTFTVSFWMKPTEQLETDGSIFGTYTDADNRAHIKLDTSEGDRLNIYSRIGGTTQLSVILDNQFTDTGAWYHIVVAIDTTQATNTDRIKVYVNGVEQTFKSATYPAQNYETYWNISTTAHDIGRYGTNTQDFDGYLTDFYFIDGQALDESSFGETDSTTGSWDPIEYAGTYGTNGFYLDFTDNSSAAALGTDRSGNSNNFSVTNIDEATDSVVDTTTNYTATSGNNGGNYAILNNLATSTELAVTRGNLRITAGSTDTGSSLATIAIRDSGKYYFECDMANDVNGACGIAPAELAYSVGDDKQFGTADSGHVLRMDTAKYQANNSSTDITYDFTPATGNIIGCLINLDDDEISWSQNGTVGTAYSIEANTVWLPFGGCFDGAGTTDHTINFGQQPFQHLPTGYQSICTTNLQDPAVDNGEDVMDVVEYEGTGLSNPITVLNFQPDIIWMKKKSVAATDHIFNNAIRGTGKRLLVNTNNNETSSTDISSYDTNGFTLPGSNNDVNQNGITFIAPVFLGGNGTTSNTDGSITTTVSVNSNANFSLFTYTGNGSSGTVGHGLGVTPKFVVIKRLGSNGHWTSYHEGVGNDKFIRFSTDGAPQNTNAWQSTNPTSSVISIGNVNAVNASDTYLCLAWAEANGITSINSYIGNGSADGPFIYTGFRPKWIIIRAVLAVGSPASRDWVWYDTTRSTVNPAESTLSTNNADAETDTGSRNINIYSNGFKIAGTINLINADTITYIYIACAESPLKTARAR